MGCSASLVVTHNSMDTITVDATSGVTDTFTMSASQKSNIKKTWKILSKDLQEIGKRILFRIILLDSHVKDVIHCTGVEGDALLRNADFNKIASRIVEVLMQLVDNIDHLHSKIAPVLMELGRIHFQIDGFIQSYWTLFLEAVMYVWRQEMRVKCTPAVTKAWTALLCFMVAKMKEGYHEACVEQTMKELNA